MFRIVGIGLAVIRQDCKVPCLCDTKPCPLFFSLKISGGEDFLVMGVPPVRPARRTEDKFIAVVEDDEGVRGMCGGYENDTHGRRCFKYG